MNKYELQQRINRQERTDTQTADGWLEEQGLDTASFASTHTRLLQAQQQAHRLLTQHRRLLTSEQLFQLEHFVRQMSNKRTRSRLKPSAATPILHTGTKVNRQIFKQNRQRIKAQH
jgi:hypothetical protein